MPSVTAAPFPIKLGGKEFSMTPMRDVDIEAMDNWVKSEHIQMVRDSFTDKMSEADKKRELAIAFEQAQGMSFMSESGAKVMRTVKGVARVVWQSLKQAHPELTPAEISGYLTSPETITYCMKIWDDLNVQKGGASGGAKASRYQKKRSTRKLQGSIRSRRK